MYPPAYTQPSSTSRVGYPLIKALCLCKILFPSMSQQASNFCMQTTHNTPGASLLQLQNNSAKSIQPRAC